MKKYRDIVEMDVDLKNIFDRLLVEPNDERRGLEAYERFASSVYAEKGGNAFRRKSGIEKFMRAAAFISIPIALIAGFLICRSTCTTTWREVYVPYGEVRTIILADSTVLKLNSGTRLTYPDKFVSRSREVFLDGEMVAEISKDRHKPFIVHADSQYVKVLGTKFDMTAYRGSETIDVHLFEGKVKFGTSTRLRQEVEMLPGHFAQYSKLKDSFSVEQFDMRYYNADSLFNNISFHKKSLRSISYELERIFGKKVVVTDEKLANTKLFAFFSNGESIDEILRLLNVDNIMEISRYDDVFYLSSRK